MNNGRVIGVDLDDVVIDFNTALCEWHNRQYGTSYRRSDITSYELAGTWGCTQTGVALFIDDSLEHAASIARAGIPMLLFDTPWNQGAVPESVTRVFSWEEVLKLV